MRNFIVVLSPVATLLTTLSAEAIHTETPVAVSQTPVSPMSMITRGTRDIGSMISLAAAVHYGVQGLVVHELRQNLATNETYNDRSDGLIK